MDRNESSDVLVAGAGVAGVAAAVAAARAGLHTALVEKTVLVGGLATTGLIYGYTPLCDGNGRQVTFGLAHEMLDLAIKYGPGDLPDELAEGGSRMGTRFSPASFVLGMDELLEGAGVDLWLDTLICLPLMEGDRVAGVEVETKSGRYTLRAQCVIDATGDADVAHRAGAPCEEADNWMSMWALGASLDVARQAAEAGDGTSLVHGVQVGGSNTGAGHPEGARKIVGVSARDVTEFTMTGRRMLREHYARLQADAGRANVFPITLPSMAQFRTTRRIIGHTTLEDGMAGRDFDDSVGVVANWWRRGEVWQVPYGTLVPQKVTGLLAAGRCISTVGEAWEVMRVIHGAVHTGEVAGVAAALAVQGDTTPDALDVADLRAELKRRGTIR